MDITITVTAQQGARIQTAVGHRYGMKDVNNAPRDATVAEVRQYIVNHLKQTVMEQERQDALVAAQIQDF